MSMCQFRPQVRDKNGEKRNSKLFEGLLEIFGKDKEGREAAKVEYLDIYLNPRFQQTIDRNTAKFDEYGEMTIDSYVKASGLEVDQEKLLKHINEKYGSKDKLTYQQAKERVLQWTKQKRYGGRYLAIMNKKHGKYTVSIVHNNKTNRTKLAESLAAGDTRTLLQQRLKSLGVSTQFLEDSLGEGVGGRYSTETYEKLRNGYLGLIQIVNDPKHPEKMEQAEIEEGAHFIVGAMADHPLMKRLLDVLSDDKIREQYLGSDYAEKYGNQNAREVAGDVVADCLNKGTYDRGPVERLLSRILSYLKQLFNRFDVHRKEGTENAGFLKSLVSWKITYNSEKANLEKVKRAAEDITRDFMMNGEGSLTSALKYKETLYNSASMEQHAYTQMASEILSIAEALKQRNSSVADQVMDIYTNMVSMRPELKPNVFGKVAATNALITAMEGMISLQGEIRRLLNETDFSKVADYNKNKVYYLSKVRDIRGLVNTACRMIEIMRNLQAHSGINYVAVPSPNGGTTTRSVTDVINKLQETIYKGHDINLNINGQTSNDWDRSIYTRLKQREYRIAIDILRDVLGDHVHISARKLFRGMHTVNAEAKDFVLSDDPAEQEKQLNSILETLNFGADGWFDRMLSTASNSKDLMVQVADKQIKYHKKLSLDETARQWRELKTIMKEMRKLSATDKVLSDTRVFCEVGEDGGITGNFVQPYNWGEWDKARKAERKRLTEEFKQSDEYKNQHLDTAPPIVKAAAISDAIRDGMREWHKNQGNSVWVEEENRYKPNADKYPSSQWNKYFDVTGLTDTEEIQKRVNRQLILNKLMKYKEDCDQRLGQKAGPEYRLPQFRGTFTDMSKSEFGACGSRIKAFTSTVKERLTSMFCVNSDDTDYGGEDAYNTVEDDPTDDEIFFHANKINRVPVYGVKPFKNGNDVSTDLFQSLLSYTVMSNDYFCLNSVADGLESVGEVIKGRDTGSKRFTTENQRQEYQETAYRRFQDFLEMKLYGNSKKSSHTVGIGGLKISFDKVAGQLNALAGKLFLGGNVWGGVVNTGTGFIELYKEGVSGEFYNRNEFREAVGLYNKEVLKSMFKYRETGKLRIDKQDLLLMLLNHWNAFGTQRSDMKHWNTRRTRANKLLIQDSLMMPYSLGDHFMQSIAYIARAKHVIVFNKNGFQKRLLDTYHVVRVGDVLKDIKKAINKGTREGLWDAEEFIASLQSIGVPFFNRKVRDLNDKDAVLKRIDSLMSIYKDQAYLHQEECYEKWQDIDIREDLQRMEKELLYDYNEEGQPINDIDIEDTKEWLRTHAKINVDDGPEAVQNALVYLREEQTKHIWGQRQDSDFMDTCREINNRLHGVYNEQDKTLASRYTLGNAFLCMKGYALGMFMRRFSTDRYVTSLGGDAREGNLITTLKVLAGLWTKDNNQGFWMTMRMLFAPTNSIKDKVLELGYSSSQFANMRRSLMDGVCFVGLNLLKAMIAMCALGLNFWGKLPPTRKEMNKDPLYITLYYLTTRWTYEQGSMDFPLYMIAELQSLVGSGLPVAGSAVYNIAKTGKQFVLQEEYGKKGNGHNDGDKKWLNFVNSYAPYWRSLKVLTDGVQMAESYTWVRAMGGIH